MRIHSDQELVAQTRAGNREAFGFLVERYQDQLFRYVRYMGFGEEDARDITQDAFVRAYRHLGRCGDPGKFHGWLFKIVSNLCRTSGRKAGRRNFRDLESVTLVDPHPGPDEATEASLSRTLIRKALGTLSPDQREAVVLFYMHGNSVREISELTGASLSAVKMRLKRGRKSLKEHLEDHFPEV